MARFANHVMHLLLTLTSLCVALALFELLCRWNGWFAPPDPKSGRPDLYVYDKDVGYHLRPLLDTTYHYPPNNPVPIPLVSNSLGYRDNRELYEPDPRTRVLVIGDSFIFGHGVRAEERITEVLEQLEPAWRVDNMGMPGWGVDMMIRALEAHGIRSRPDVVIMAIYTDDFRRVHPYFSGVGYRIPRFELHEGKLVSVPYPVVQGWQRSRIYQAIYQSVTYNKHVRDRFDLHTALLDRFLQDAGAEGFRPVILFLPGKTDTPVDKQRRAFLEQWSQAHSVPYLDLTAAIYATGVKETYLRNNWHWNATGHRIAAQQLRMFLDEYLPAH